MKNQTWFVVGRGYWGKGSTFEEAKKQYKIAGGDFKKSMYGGPVAMLYTHESHTTMSVDSQGGIYCTSTDPTKAAARPIVEQHVPLNSRGMPSKKS